MSYIRYNTYSNRAEGRLYMDHYNVDGEPTSLPFPLVELEYIQEPQPTSTPKDKYLHRTETVDLPGKRLVRGWELVDIPSEVLSAQNRTNIRSQARAMFASLDTDIRAQFGAAFVTAIGFLDLGDWEAAIKVIENQQVPSELSTIKDAILTKLHEGIV